MQRAILGLVWVMVVLIPDPYLRVFAQDSNNAREETASVQVTVDAKAEGKRLKHIWPYFGYDECNFATSAGAQALMKTLSQITTVRL